jgi:sugar phosphate isomerase/epimerase
MPTLASTTTRDRVGISTISFRFRPLDEALAIIARLGATEVDLGAIPDVTDHVPVPFTGDPAAYVAALEAHRLRAGAVNSDVGHLNDPELTRTALAATVRPLVALAAATGSTLIVPCGRNSYDAYVDEETDLATIATNLRYVAELCGEQDVRLLVEVLHHRRYVHSVERAEKVLDMLGPDVFGLLFDVSHIVASSDDPVAWATRRADRVERVHLRDAVPGNLNLGIGRGDADFAATIGALEAGGFTGTYILELETHDVEEQDREADAARSRAEILTILEAVAAR